MIREEAIESVIAEGTAIISMMQSEGWKVYEQELKKRYKKIESDVFILAADVAKIEQLRDKVKELNVFKTILQIPEFISRDYREAVKQKQTSHSRKSEGEV